MAPRHALTLFQFAPLLAALALPSSGCIEISGDVQDLHKDVRDAALHIKGAGTLAGTPATTTRIVQVDLSADLKDLVQSGEVTQATIHPDGGVTHFAFMHSVRIGFGATDTLPAVAVAQYTRAQSDGNPEQLPLTIIANMDQTEYVKRPFTLVVDLDYDAQAADWGILVELTADLSLGLKASL